MRIVCVCVCVYSSAVHDAKVQYMLVLEVVEAELVGVVKGMVKSLVQEEVRNAKKKKAYQLEKLRKKFVINHLVRKCWDRYVWKGVVTFLGRGCHFLGEGIGKGEQCKYKTDYSWK